jgi:hypothetical protein
MQCMQQHTNLMCHAAVTTAHRPCCQHFLQQQGAPTLQLLQPPCTPRLCSLQCYFTTAESGLLQKGFRFVLDQLVLAALYQVCCRRGSGLLQKKPGELGEDGTRRPTPYTKLFYGLTCTEGSSNLMNPRFLAVTNTAARQQ